MATRLPALTIALACAVWATARGQESADSSPFTQIIDGETLRRAGVMRLADVLRFLDDWDPLTIDEFTWHAVPAGSAPLPDARWIVIVDGQRMELDLFGTTSLNRLPVPLGIVDHVAITRTPIIAAGDLAVFGVIHIRTREPLSGPALEGWVTTGSEIGDPGPFAFTPLSTLNVDRIGNDASGQLSYGGTGWFVTGGIRFGRHNFTDPAISTRYGAAAGGLGVKVTLLGFSARAGLRSARGQHELVAYRSRADDHLPLDPFAAELAARERYTHIGATGRLGLGGVSAIRYTAAWSANEADARGSPVAAPFAWRAETATLGVEAEAEPGSLRVLGGARLRRIAVNADRPIEEPRLTLGTLYGSAQLARDSGISPVLRSALTLTGEEAGVALALGGGWRVAGDWSAQGELSYARPVRASDNGIWAWTERGDPLLENSGTLPLQDGPLQRLEALGADLALVQNGPHATVRLSALWRLYDGVALERRELDFVSADRSFAGTTRLFTRGGGQVAGGLLQAASPLGDVARATVAYRLLGAVVGEAPFRAAAAIIPVHMLRSSFSVTPAPGLDLWAMLTWRSSTRWEDFRAVEAQSGGAYRARVPGWADLELAVQKWFWRRRLRAHAGFRNVFGSAVRYHPAGAEVGPRLLLQAEAAFP